MNETTNAQGQSAFSRIFSDVFSSATTILSEVGKVRAQGYIQELEAKNAAKVQAALQKNAASPGNDQADAHRAALENTVNLFGFITVPREHAPLYTLGFVAVAVLSIGIVLKFLRK